MRLSLALGTSVAILFASALARADNIALLPSRGDASSTTALDVDLARALASMGHSLVPGDQVAAAIKQGAQDGVADTVEEYRAVGALTKADWVVVGNSATPGLTSSRIEISACLVGQSRVESVAREVDKAKALEEEKEMLAVLLRPEGIGAAELPWEKAPPKQVATPPQPPVVVTPPPPPAVPEGPMRDLVKMDYMSTTEDVWPAYGNKRWMFSAVQGFSVAAARPKNAAGSGAAIVLDGRIAYTLGDRGLELFADVGGNLAGPRAVFFNGGARWMFTPSKHKLGDQYAAGSWFIGPEIDLGAFLRLPGPDVKSPAGVVYSGHTVASPLIGASLDLVIAASPSFALEASMGDLRVLPASDGTLLLFGATLGASLRL